MRARCWRTYGDAAAAPPPVAVQSKRQKRKIPGKKGITDLLIDVRAPQCLLSIVSLLTLM